MESSFSVSSFRSERFWDGAWFSLLLLLRTGDLRIMFRGVSAAASVVEDLLLPLGDLLRLSELDGGFCGFCL